MCAVVGGLLLGAPLPSFGDDAAPTVAVHPRLKALVERHLRADPDYVSGDLLTRADVEPIFNELIELGIPPSTGDDGLYNPYLRDDDYLATLLRSPQGRALMREVAVLRGAYDFLERLSWLPAGRSWLRQLAADPNGAKLVADMMTEDGLKKIADAVGNNADARNLSLPTGRVHTEAELLVRLQRMLESQSRKSAKSQSPGK
jgi:hypothetical protein